MNGLVDTFSIPGLNIPDAHPAAIAQENANTQAEYVIPLGVWMIVFLVVGYLGLRWVMED